MLRGLSGVQGGRPEPVPPERQLTTRLPEPLLIYADDDGGCCYTVCSGERWENRLTNDEALWVVSSYLHGRTNRYLKTAEDHAARRAAWNSYPEDRVLYVIYPA